jgi:hypothetical protein
MHMAGFFPSVPTQVNFHLSFAPINGQWRLFGISVSIGQSAPAAPTSPEPAAQKQPSPNGAVPNGAKQAASPNSTRVPAAKPATAIKTAPDCQQPK